MKENAINLTQAKAKFSEIASKAVFGDELYVIDRMGKPFVVLMSYNEFERLKNSSSKSDVLKEAQKLRKYFKKRYGSQPDSTQLIRQMRDERDAKWS